MDVRAALGVLREWFSPPGAMAVLPPPMVPLGQAVEVVLARLAALESPPAGVAAPVYLPESLLTWLTHVAHMHGRTSEVVQTLLRLAGLEWHFPPGVDTRFDSGMVLRHRAPLPTPPTVPGPVTTVTPGAEGGEVPALLSPTPAADPAPVPSPALPPDPPPAAPTESLPPPHPPNGVRARAVDSAVVQRGP